MSRYKVFTVRPQNQKWSIHIVEPADALHGIGIFIRDERRVTMTTDFSDRSRRVSAGLEMLGAAAEMARGYYDQRSLEVDVKRDGTPVTAADRQIETMLREEVNRQFDGDGFLGEEYVEKPAQDRWRWIVDPIDGTKSFIHRVPLYANLIALEEDGEIVFGALAFPSLGVTMHAEQGRGCWRNGVQVHVSSRSDLEGAHVMATWLEDWNCEVLSDLQSRGVVVRTWGDAFGYAMVAGGDADAVVDYTAQTFDLAPMPVLIEEAGGTFTSLDGKRDINAGHGIASNGLLHDVISTSVKQRDPFHEELHS